MNVVVSCSICLFYSICCVCFLDPGVFSLRKLRAVLELLDCLSWKYTGDMVNISQNPNSNSHLNPRRSKAHGLGNTRNKSDKKNRLGTHWVTPIEHVTSIYRPHVRVSSIAGLAINEF